MPVVRIPQSQVATNPAPNARKDTISTVQLRTAEYANAPTAETFGAGLGDTMSRVGLSVLSSELDYKQKEWVKANQIAVALRKGDLLGETRSFLKDPEKGILNTHLGEAALQAPDLAKKFFKDTYARIRESLNNDDQRVAFDLESINIQEQYNADVADHVTRQVNRADAANYQSLLSLEANEAIDHADEPNWIIEKLGSLDDEIRRYGERQGLGKPWIADQQAKSRSGVWSGVVDRLLAAPGESSAQRAKVVFDSVQDQILGGDRDRLETKIGDGIVQGQSNAAARRIWERFGPKAATDTANLKSLMDVARDELAESHPKQYEAVSAQLKERVGLHNGAIAQEDDANVSHVYQAIAKGITVPELVAMPEYQAIQDGHKKTELVEHTADRGETLKQRFRSDQNWMWTLEDRDYTKAERAEHAKTMAGYGEYFRLSKAENISRMSEDQIIGLTGKLGPQLVDSLLQRSRSIKAKNGDVLPASIDDEAFNAAAESAGLKPYASPSSRTEIENARLGMLRNRVETLISIEQGSKKRELTREEKDAIMHREIDDKVKLSLGYWQGDVFLPAGAVTPGQAGKTSEPLGVPGIPAENLSPALNYMRSLNIVPQGMSDAQAARQFRSQLERAYAARQAGQLDQALRILRGGLAEDARRFAEKVLER